MAGKAGTVDNHRITVALTFDFDAESIWKFMNQGKAPAAVSRGTYGAREGVPRILKLLDRYKLPASFFVPGYTAEVHTDLVHSIASAGHEINHHCYMHEAPNLITLDEERVSIEKGLETLDRVLGIKPRGYRAPSGELSPHTLGLLAEYGFEYDSTQYAEERPYWAEVNGRRLDLVEIPLAVELVDACHFKFTTSPIALPGLSAASKVEEIWRDEFDGAYQEDRDACFTIIMHPQIIGRHHRMQMLERFICHVLEHDGVWFARLGEVNDEFRKRQARSI
jgi:peptidoglycan/xylan/chitin deacetylase (PgdA/CDA1 family)